MLLVKMNQEMALTSYGMERLRLLDLLVPMMKIVQSSSLSNTVHNADVVALSKLTCLVLPREHLALLWPKSIWSAEKRPERRSAVENILQLEPLK
ncbi:acyl-coenzyme A thioesterase 8-like protein, partial [Trifolium pratense]